MLKEVKIYTESLYILELKMCTKKIWMLTSTILLFFHLKKWASLVAK